MLIDRDEKLILTTMEYKCTCGAVFEISRSNGESGIKVCPYCGIERNENSEPLTFHDSHSYEIAEKKF